MVGTKRMASIAAIAGLAAVGVAAIPHSAQAWWRGGYGFRVWVPPVFVAPPPPVYYAPPPVAYYGPPRVAYYGPPRRVWIPPHWNGPYWVRGHWA